MASTKLTVQGLPELKKRLETTLPAAIRKGMGDAMAKGADRVVRLAATLVPKDSGELARTIRRTEPRVSPKNGMLYVAIVAGGTSTEVGKNNHYQLARIIEFGTMKRNPEGRDPEPFFFPAWRRNKRGIRSGINRAIAKALKG